MSLTIAGALAPLLALAAAAQVAPAAILLEGEAVQGGLLRGQAPAGAVSLSLDGNPIPVAPDGRFIIAFDRDQPARAVVTAQLANGRQLAREVAVAPRAWRIERVNVAQRPSGSSEEYRRRRQAELARIAAARAQQVRSEGWRQRFIWPARGRISGVFGSQRIYRGEPGAYHSGVDVAPGAGAPVVAPADGVVVLAGPPMFTLEGNLAIVDHGMGLNSAFLHLGSVSVQAGQPVRQGQLIGTVGATGRATGPHLHWSMKWNEARIDPQALAGPMGN
jgi:murein DD-endopeptidase MepM/ murein hydrolase activator NlpD